MTKLMKPYLVKYRSGLSGDKIVFASDEAEAVRAGVAEFRYNTYGPDRFKAEDVVLSVEEKPAGTTCSTTRRTTQYAEDPE